MQQKLETRPGEIWALTGDSASGHSELLRSYLDMGSAWVSFRHPFRNRSNTTDLYYQQRYNSYDAEDSLTVREYLEQAWSGHPGDKAYLEHIEAVLDLAPLLDEQLIKLSNGETRKVLIAEAWARRPRILLLDHPFTGLDVRSRSGLPSILKEIAATGATVLMATGPFDIPEVVDKVVLIQGGAVVQVFNREAFRPDEHIYVQDLTLDPGKLTDLLSGRKPTDFGTIVRMNDVNITYKDHHILEHINWEVLPGERWALTGPNGAGKSTLLSLIVGDNPQAYANDITLFDRKRGSGESIWDIKRHTGFVSPEFYQYFPTQTLCIHAIESGFFDTVGLFRTSDPALESICRQWMALMGIESQAWKPLNQVKPDVQRLCLLARALVKNPTLLVLDEPTQGLDATQQRFFVQLIDAICERSDVTLLYVSHYREHIPRAVTRELMLERGRIAGAAEIEIKLVDNEAELRGIRELQQANLRNNITDEEAAREGFVTASYTMEFLNEMHRAHPSVIAKQGDRVVGYALVATQEVRYGHPLLEDLFDKLDRIEYEGRPFRTCRYVVIGQLCVAKTHRSMGLVNRMYGFYRERLSKHYEFCLADIVQSNVRSLRAHQKTGFNVVGTLEYGGVVWDVVLWDWR